MSEFELKKLIKELYESTGVTFELDDDDTWDSLLHIAILVGLDEAFKGRVSSINELQSARSVADIVDVLKKNNLVN